MRKIGSVIGAIETTRICNNEGSLERTIQVERQEARKEELPLSSSPDDCSG